MKTSNQKPEPTRIFDLYRGGDRHGLIVEDTAVGWRISEQTPRGQIVSTPIPPQPSRAAVFLAIERAYGSLAIVKDAGMRWITGRK